MKILIADFKIQKYGGIVEYVAAMIILAILLSLGGRVCSFFLGFQLDDVTGYIYAFLTHLFATLWMRKRYAKGVTNVAGPTCWNIVVPCVMLVVFIDMFVVFMLRWLDQSMSLDLVPPPKEENVTVVMKGADFVAKCLLAPLCEEFIFRFALVSEAQKLAGTSAEISTRIQGALSGVAFGLMHIGAAFSAGESPVIALSHVCFAACFGVAMVFLDSAAGNRLWPSIICHICNNALVFFMPLNTAVTEWRSIAILASTVLVQSAALVGISFVPVCKPAASKEHEHSN